jgi:glyoxylase-like metal-dependent hydrolase (beta-lactamase superfamily II)
VRTGRAEVAPGLFRLPGIAAQGVNAYVWHPRPDEREVGEPVVFDCGLPFSGRALTVSLVALGCEPAAVRTIAITHDDFDHTGRLHALQGASGAEVACGEWEANRLLADTWRNLPRTRNLLGLGMRGVSGLGYLFYKKRPVTATRLLVDGETLTGEWIAVHTPGHTPGHTSYFHTGQRLLIAGDVLGSVHRGSVRPAFSPFADDADEVRQSVRKLAELEPRVICFGHGPELHDAAGPLRKLADLADSVREELVTARPSPRAAARAWLGRRTRRR